MSALGLDGARGSHPAPKGRTTHAQKPEGKKTLYEIRDPSGRLIARHIRLDLPDKSKTFYWETPDGRLTLDCKVEDLPLYGSELISTFDRNRPIIVTEGEKACVSLRNKGYQCLATTTGASTIPSVAVLRSLVGFGNIVLWPDADAPGLLHMRRIAARLAALGVRVRIISPPNGVRPGWDGADAVDEGADIEALLAQARPYDGPPERLPFLAVSARSLLEDKTITPPRALIPGLLPAGFSIIGGRPKIGKTFFALQLSLGLASGGLIFGKIKPDGAHDVVYCALEDGENRIKSRLLQLSEVAAPSDRLQFVFTASPMPEALQFLSEWAQDHRDGVIVLDVLARLLPKRRSHRNAYEESYEHLAALADLTRAFNVHIVGIHHLRKGDSDPDDVTASLVGGSGFGAVPDAILILRPGPGFTQLDVISRDWPFASYALRFSDLGGWVWLGKASEALLTARQREALAVIESAGGRTTTAALARALGVTRGTAADILHSLARAGVVQREKDGIFILAQTDGEDKRIWEKHADTSDTAYCADHADGADICL